MNKRTKATIEIQTQGKPIKDSVRVIVNGREVKPEQHEVGDDKIKVFMNKKETEKLANHIFDKYKKTFKDLAEYDKQEKSVHSIIESGELDLGFCKLVVKEIKGSKGKSHNTIFTRKPFYKLGVKMSKEFKALLNK